MKTTEPNGLDLSSISPINGPKYSPNLHQWMSSKRNKIRSWAFRVYRDTDGILWIGTQDGRELIGSRLVAVLCNGAKETTACYYFDAVEVSGFWGRYVKDGRCAIDEDHSMYFINSDGRFKTIGDTRECQWCGKATQTLKRWTETVEREAWVNVVAAAA